MEISRGMHGITFEVVRTFQSERLGAKKLSAKAADREVQEELDMSQLHASILSMSIENVKKAIKAHREGDWSAQKHTEAYRSGKRTR